MKLYPIFKKQYAMMLRDMGNPIMDASSNDRNPKFVIYFFEETKKFKEDLNNIQSN